MTNQPPTPFTPGARSVVPTRRGERRDHSDVRRVPLAIRSEGSLRLVNRVIVPVEGSAGEFFVQQWAMQMAAAVGANALGLHVSPPAGTTPPDVFDQLRHEASRWNVSLEHRVILGTNAAEEIAAELGPRDLVVIGSRRLPTRGELGSNARDLVRLAPCPVVVLRLT